MKEKWRKSLCAACLFSLFLLEAVFLKRFGAPPQPVWELSFAFLLLCHSERYEESVERKRVYPDSSQCPEWQTDRANGVLGRLPRVASFPPFFPLSTSRFPLSAFRFRAFPSFLLNLPHLPTRAHEYYKVCPFAPFPLSVEKYVLQHNCKSVYYKQSRKKFTKKMIICLALKLKAATFASAIERDAVLTQNDLL